MDNETKERIKQEAREWFNGFYVRGLSKDRVVNTLLHGWSNELLQAVTGRSANQVSRYRTGRSKLGEPERDAIYSFYQELSNAPLPLGAEEPDYQNYPFYTLEEARDSYNQLHDCLKEIDYIVNTKMKSATKSFRALRDKAPYKTQKDVPIVATDTMPSTTNGGDSNTSNGSQSAGSSLLKIQSKKDFLAQQQQAEEQAQAEREGQARIPKDKNGKPLKPVHFTTGETKDGQPMLSTDGGMTWYRQPNFPVRDLTVLMGWDDKSFEGMDKYLTMKDRLIGELMQSLDFVPIPVDDKEMQNARNQAYQRHPAAFWKIYFTYGADDNFTLRQNVSNLEAMRKSSIGDPFFKTVEELHEFEDKMERYLVTHKSDFAPEDVAKYFDRDEDAMNIDGSYVAADEDEPIDEVKYNTLYNFNGPYRPF